MCIAADIRAAEQIEFEHAFGVEQSRREKLLHGIMGDRANLAVVIRGHGGSSLAIQSKPATGQLLERG